MSKFSFGFGEKLRNLLSKPVDEKTIDSLEKLFFEADLGSSIASKLAILAKNSLKKGATSDEILDIVEDELLKILNYSVTDKIENSPHVIVLVGANGSGKTTTAAKLANHYKKDNKKVLLVACDTFRIAAIEQLTLWAEKLDIDIVKAQIGSDAAALAFDGISKAITKKYDVVIIDTAGRLHTKDSLMQELYKITKVCNKKIEGSPHETLLVLDGTIGQNGIDQARVFNETSPISNLVITKLDGSAKGGLCVALKQELNLEVKWLGFGEKIDDLVIFDSKAFVSSITK